jgi:hypothetical protein
VSQHSGFTCFLELLLPVEVADAKIAASEKRLEVCELQDPDTHRSSRTVEPFLLKVNGQEDFLEQILRFRPVSQDLVGHGIDLAKIPMEQNREAVRAFSPDIAQQVFIGKRIGMGVLGNCAWPSNAAMTAN